MIKRIIEISNPAKLSVNNRQLVIERKEKESVSIPAEDIGILIVDHPAVSYTQGVFVSLLEQDAAIILCGPNHHPTGLVLSLNAHTTQTERHRAQIEASLPLKKRLWQQIIEQKILQQANLLEKRSGSDGNLREMAKRVRSGDPDNLEAQAAQRYWPLLLGKDFRRHRAGPPPNSLLNYGYMILRAGMARALVGSGLIATLGLHHRNRYNPFCLADDLMEPYRPYVDAKVCRLMDEGPVEEIGRAEKQALLSLFNETILVGDRRSPLMLALQQTSASLARSFEVGEAELALPEGLFMEPKEKQTEDKVRIAHASGSGR